MRFLQFWSWFEIKIYTQYKWNFIFQVSWKWFPKYLPVLQKPHPQPPIQTASDHCSSRETNPACTHSLTLEEQLQHWLKTFIVPSTSWIHCWEIEGHHLLQHPYKNTLHKDAPLSYDTYQTHTLYKAHFLNVTILRTQMANSVWKAPPSPEPRPAVRLRKACAVLLRSGFREKTASAGATYLTHSVARSPQRSQHRDMPSAAAHVAVHSRGGGCISWCVCTAAPSRLQHTHPPKGSIPAPG